MSERLCPCCGWNVWAGKCSNNSCDYTGKGALAPELDDEDSSADGPDEDEE